MTFRNNLFNSTSENRAAESVSAHWRGWGILSYSARGAGLFNSNPLKANETLSLHITKKCKHNLDLVSHKLESNRARNLKSASRFALARFLRESCSSSVQLL